MKSLLRFLHSIKSHSVSFLIGAFLTIALSLAAGIYFNHSSHEEHDALFLGINSLHTKFLDFKMRFRGPQPTDSQLAIIAVDDRSLTSLGRWPWPRHKMAQLIEELYRLGAKNVGLDMIFSESSNRDLKKIVSDISNLSIDPITKDAINSYIKKKNSTIFSDDYLAKVFKKHQNNLIVGTYYIPPRISLSPHQQLCFNFLYENSPQAELWEEEGFDFIQLVSKEVSSSIQLPEKLTNELENTFAIKKTSNRNLKENCIAWLEKQNHKINSKGFFSALLPVDHWTTNTPLLHRATRLSGFLNVQPDPDGTIRNIPLLVRTGPYILPSLALRMASKIIDADGGQITLTQDPLAPKFLQVSSLELTKEAEVISSVKTNQQGQVRINFSGPPYSYPHISAKELLEPNSLNLKVTYNDFNAVSNSSVLHRLKEKPKDQFLKGKTVLIGATAVGIYDLRVTPFHENYPGVEAHLNVIDNIVNNKPLSSLKEEPPYMILSILLLGFALTSIFSLAGATFSFLSAFISLTSILYLDYYFFLQSIVLTTIFPLFLVLLLYASITIFKYFSEERKKEALRGTFEKYVSPAIVKEVLVHPDNLKLGGRKEHMSVFFSDIRGFTTISETLEPQALSDLLNLYLTPMTDLVFENNGTLDKYMGDAIMAFFGAPVKNNHHANDACHCAIDHMKHLKQLNKQLNKQNLPLLDIGIGINTGDMSVGNMGSQSVRSYTVMGDAVNLGARLESINKQYGTHIIISEFTEKELSSKFLRREIDKVKVKGKKLPVKIFELFHESPNQESLKLFNLGYQFYHKQEWQKALTQFEVAFQINKDPTSKLYISRCNDFIKKPPAIDWDGVFTMTTK